MNRGVIIVEGNAGNEVGATMRRGLIAITGDTGDFAGAFTIAGSVVVFGKLGIRAGAGLLRGTIVALYQPELLPTFRYACSYRPPFLHFLFQDLRPPWSFDRKAMSRPVASGATAEISTARERRDLIYDQR